MGGSSSTANITDSSSVQSAIMLNATADCISSASGGNTIDVSGNYNSIVDNQQNLAITFDSSCNITEDENADFNSLVTSGINSNLSSTTQEALGWLDDTRTSQQETITSLVSSSVNVSTTQQCMSNVSTANQIDVQGSYNYIGGNIQNATLKSLTNCVLSNASGATSSNVIANTSNLSTTYTSANFFSPLMDAFISMSENIAIMLVILVILAGIVVAAYKFYMMRLQGQGLDQNISPLTTTNTVASKPNLSPV